MSSEIITKWEKPVHTIVRHQNSDAEAMAMVWILLREALLRALFGITDNVKHKVISAGPLRQEEWPEVPGVESTTGFDLEALGFLGVDCMGGTFDQHTAKVNRGRKVDAKSSVELLFDATGLLDKLGQDYYLALLRAIAENDRTGKSVTADTITVDDENGHIPRDLRTLAGVLNDCYPNEPELVLEIYLQTLDGIKAAFEAYVTDHKVEDYMALDLRALNFLTIDTARTGLKNALEEELVAQGMSDEAKRNEFIAARIAWFDGHINDALTHAEASWQQARLDVKRAKRITFQLPLPNGRARWSKNPRKTNDDPTLFTVIAGRSSSRYFGKRARQVGANVVIQFHPDHGDSYNVSHGDTDSTPEEQRIDLTNVTMYLRLADAWSRGSEVLGEGDFKLFDKGMSWVIVDGEQQRQMHNAGFSVGTYFHSSADNTLPSVMKPEEIVHLVVRGLLYNGNYAGVFQGVKEARAEYREMERQLVKRDVGAIQRWTILKIAPALVPVRPTPKSLDDAPPPADQTMLVDGVEEPESQPEIVPEVATAAPADVAPIEPVATMSTKRGGRVVVKPTRVVVERVYKA